MTKDWKIDLKERVTNLVIAHSGGEISHEDLARVDGSLKLVGYNSLSFMALVSGLEKEFGVFVDLEEEPDKLYTVNGIVGFVCEQRSASPEAV